ncbi:MAG TPA: ParB N-terminal domain-containing protein [Pirellulales bacterium]|nr:ParB N-terminal domain-containing protein [Pirellulales bacterium]
MQIRDRIRELRRVRASQLRPHPRNWRTHPEEQRDALRGVLAEIGYAGALLARELDDGTLELIDGHLRAETTPDAEVPVLVLDLSAEEANKLLTLLDPLASLAETNGERLAALVAEVETDSAAVRALLDRLTEEAQAGAALLATPGVPATPQDGELPELYQLIVECAGEAEQRALFDRLSAEGFHCRVMVL